MAGLNDLISDKAQEQTTLPGWFDTAQQNVVNQAQGAFGTAPSPQNTVAQNAVTALQGPTNAFTQAGSTLQNIATGAANPWIVDQTTGQVTPNTSTALGGLFAAQNRQLEQLMPNVTAPVQGANIASGQFGSLRGQTAYNKAMADAQAQLASEQMKAALQNQQTGVQAGLGVGNVTQQELENLLKVGQYQQAAPFINVSNLGKVVGGIQAPTTVTRQTQLSPLNQIAGLLTLLQGRSGQGGVLGSLGLPNIQGIVKSLGGALGIGGGIGAGLAAGTYDLAGSGGKLVIDATGNRMITNPDGSYQTFDKDNNLIDSGQAPVDQGGGSDTDVSPPPDDGTGDTEGGYIDWGFTGGGGDSSSGGGGGNFDFSDEWSGY